MVNVIILGKGFVGTNLYNHLTKNTSLHVSIVSQTEVNYFNEILLKKYVRETQNIFHNVAEDIILINCSGFTGRPNVDECEVKKEICFKYNTELPVLLSNFCKRNKLWFVNVSSGCIYSGYDKEYTEDDIPNYGIFNSESSFYSKTKHLSEILSCKDVSSSLRIRMPFCDFSSERNFLCKLIKYDKLISFDNSLTSLHDFCTFVELFLLDRIYKTNPGIFNVVNPGSANGKQIVDLFLKYNIINKNWSFVDLKNLNLKAGRTNCILSTQKINFFNLELPNVFESLEACIKKLANEIS